MSQLLFLSPHFETFCVGFAEGDAWMNQLQQKGHITDHLYTVLQPIVNQCQWDTLIIYLLNGPGSTLGIRTCCAFIQTLLAIHKIQLSQVYLCDNLHFAQYYLQHQKATPQPVCARVNLTQTLCLGPQPTDVIHQASEAEKQQSLWLVHPCLSPNLPFFSFQLEAVLPLLRPQPPWHNSTYLDIFNPSKPHKTAESLA